MRAWRLTPSRHAGTAFTGYGASLYGGRWNRPGTAVVYVATSLALAMLEVVVHATGLLAEHTAIELDIPDDEPDTVEAADLADDWRDNELLTQSIGTEWAGTAALVLSVPSVVVDPRAPGERNLMLNPASVAFTSMREVQRFTTVIDARLR